MSQREQDRGSEHVDVEIREITPGDRIARMMEIDGETCSVCQEPIGPTLGEDEYTGHPCNGPFIPCFSTAAGNVCADCVDL